MNTNWQIAQLKRIPATGLVIEVTYIMNFTLESVSDRKVGSITLSGSTDEPGFVPYEELTEQIVLGWVQSDLGQQYISDVESEMQTRLQERLNEINNPPFITGKPWEQNN